MSIAISVLFLATLVQSTLNPTQEQLAGHLKQNISKMIKKRVGPKTLHVMILLNNQLDRIHSQ